MDRELTFRIILTHPPKDVDFGLQKGSGSKYETVQIQRSQSNDLQFECNIRVKTGADANPNFLGPFVQGPVSQRFIYIDIGTCAGQKNTVWSRRLKIPLKGITWAMIDQCIKTPEKILETQVPGTGRDGGPNCATVKPFAGWKIVTATES